MATSGNFTDFWVAVAASAPVIALAALVPMPDAAVAGSMLKRAKDNGQPPAQRIFLQRLGPQSFWVIMWGIATLVTQGVVLIVALLALLQGVTPKPAIWIIVVEGVGLLLLLVATLLAGEAGAQRQQLEVAGTNTADEIRKLAELRAAGTLTEDEFTARKKQLLAL